MTFYSKTLVDPYNPPKSPHVSSIVIHELVPGAPEHVKTLEVGRVIYNVDVDEETNQPSSAQYAREMSEAFETLAGEWKKIADDCEASIRD